MYLPVQLRWTGISPSSTVVGKQREAVGCRTPPGSFWGVRIFPLVKWRGSGIDFPSPCWFFSHFFPIFSNFPQSQPPFQRLFCAGEGLPRAGEEMLGFTPFTPAVGWVEAVGAVGTEERWNTWSTKATSANEAWPVSLHGREVASWAFWQWMATPWPCARHMTCMTWRLGTVGHGIGWAAVAFFLAVE